MAKLNTTKAVSTESVMLYGAPKTGKTQLAGELAEYFDLIWIDLEGGHNTLYKMPTAWQERVELVNIPDSNVFPIGIETCLKMVKKAVNICELHGKVECMICKKTEDPFVHVDLFNQPESTIVVFDSSTQLTNSAIAQITKKQDDEYKLQTDDWGVLSHLMDVFFSQIQTLPVNRIVISHDSMLETENKKKTLVPVAGSSNFSRNVAKYFGHVVYCERKNLKHTFSSSTTGASNILMGSRTDVTMEDATKPSLLAIFKPELFKERDAIEAAKAAATSKTSTASVLAKLQAKAKAKT